MRAIQTPFQVGIVGAGMAGLSAARELRRCFPGIQTTLFESSDRVGGRIADRYEGAEFIDAPGHKAFQVIHDMLKEHGLETHEREDYDLNDFYDSNGNRTMSGEEYIDVLRRFKRCLKLLLNRWGPQKLDQWSIVDLIHALTRPGQLPEARFLRQKDLFSPKEAEGMIARIVIEYGAKEISSAFIALEFSRIPSPLKRYQVAGGYHRVLEAEVEAFRRSGGEIIFSSPVAVISRQEMGARLVWEGENPGHRTFNSVVLTAPTNRLSRIQIEGFPNFPKALLENLKTTQIYKTIVRVRTSAETPHVTSQRFQTWDILTGEEGIRTIVFFHGAEGEKPLTTSEIRAWLKKYDQKAKIIDCRERSWGPDEDEGYVAVPKPGQAFDLMMFGLRQLYANNDVSLLYAGQALRGVYTADAAFTGREAARTLGIKAGYPVGRRSGQSRNRLFNYYLGQSMSWSPKIVANP